MPPEICDLPGVIRLQEACVIGGHALGPSDSQMGVYGLEYHGHLPPFPAFGAGLGAGFGSSTFGSAAAASLAPTFSTKG